MSDEPTPAVHCWDELPYFTALEHACGHTVEIHTLVQPNMIEFVPLTGMPCAWCIAIAGGGDADQVNAVEHTHFMYRRGDAVFRRSTLTVAEHNALHEMEIGLSEDCDG